MPQKRKRIIESGFESKSRQFDLSLILELNRLISLIRN